MDLGNHWSQLGGRVGMGSTAQNHVDQDQSGLGIGRFLTEPLDPEPWVHHRVQSTDGVFVRTQIQDGVTLAFGGVGQGFGNAPTQIGVDGR